MFEQQQHAEVAPVAVVRESEAELLLTALRVHGIDAHATAAHAFPSIEWAEGRAITVQVDRHADAAELLRGLGHLTLPLPD